MADGNARPAEQFDGFERQETAARLGMWVFLASEVLFFAGLFALYLSYRTLYHDDFVRAAAHNNQVIGTINTFVLITSSLSVALAYHYKVVRALRRARALLLATLVLGVAFLVLKGVEYAQHAAHGLLPGDHFHNAELDSYGARLLFSLYFFMTGLHGLHVIAGLVALGWIWVGSLRASFAFQRDIRIELGALYWHLVDLIWIFLWPLLYLTH